MTSQLAESLHLTRLLTPTRDYSCLKLSPSSTQMATKRKSTDVLDLSDSRSDDSIDGHSTKENDAPPPPAKKARLSSASEAEGSSTQSKGKGKGKSKASEKASAPTRWQDVVLETNADVSSWTRPH